MAATYDEIRAALLAEEPEYDELAAAFGPAALAHLQKLIESAPSLLASKAAYLAGVIGSEEASAVVRSAAASGDVRVRLAAAAGARYLSDEKGSEILSALLDDSDIGVLKVALKAAPAVATAALRERIEKLKTTTGDDSIRQLSGSILAEQLKIGGFAAPASDSGSDSGAGTGTGPALNGGSTDQP